MLHQHNMGEFAAKPIYIVRDVQQLVPIAPAIEKNYPRDEVEVRKYCYKSNPYTGAQAASIARRNARERNRVKQVNDGFSALKKRLPASVIAALSGGSRRGSGKKLSKVDTLKMVVEYIRYLQNLIEESDAALGITHTPIEMQNNEVDEGVYGDSSPYADSVPSPTGSECSSGVSLSYSPNNDFKYQNHQKSNPMDEEDLLDAISWWQNK